MSNENQEAQAPPEAGAPAPQEHAPVRGVRWVDLHPAIRSVVTAGMRAQLAEYQYAEAKANANMLSTMASMASMMEAVPDDPKADAYQQMMGGMTAKVAGGMAHGQAAIIAAFRVAIAELESVDDPNAGS